MRGKETEKKAFMTHTNRTIVAEEAGIGIS
jgi:hypothetical protein